MGPAATEGWRGGGGTCLGPRRCKDGGQRNERRGSGSRAQGSPPRGRTETLGKDISVDSIATGSAPGKAGKGVPGTLQLLQVSLPPSKRGVGREALRWEKNVEMAG